MTDVRITLDDLRAVGICTRSRDWFAGHGLDFARLRAVNGGIPVSELYALNDQAAQVRRLEQAAIQRLEAING